MNWLHYAKCKDEDPELFFPTGNGRGRGGGRTIALQTEQAKAVCRRCTVTEDCLEWALESGQDAGVWGGYSEEERRTIKRRGGLRAA